MKSLLLIVILLNTAISFAQLPSSGFLQRKFSLDDFSSLRGAYSIRRLRSVYAGPAINVRRSDNSATSDIGFLSDGSLDVTSLTTFCGSVTCYVTIWYDQSGNGIHATQVSLGAQPMIVNNGVVAYIGTKPAITFSGSQWLNTTINLNRALLPNIFVSSVVKFTNTSSGSQSLWGADQAWGRFQLLFFALSTPLSFAISNGVTALGQVALNTTSAIVYNAGLRAGVASGSMVCVNGSCGAFFTESATGSVNTMAIGSMGSAGSVLGQYPGQFQMAEFVLLGTGLSTQSRKAIEFNQSRYYGILVN